MNRSFRSSLDRVGTRQRSKLHRGQRGQVIVLFAVALVVILGMFSIAVDGSFGFVQARRAQNGVDFASLAATRALGPMCDAGQSPPSDAVIENTIRDVMSLNTDAVGTRWQAQYLDMYGARITAGGAPWLVGSRAYPPPNACGVAINASPQWNTYLAGVIGTTQATAVVNAAAANRPGTGQLASIVALNKVGGHSVLAGGENARFIVNGDMYLNSTATMWAGIRHGLYLTDIVDSKDQASLYVYGVIHSAQGAMDGIPWFPLDECFGDLAGPVPNVDPYPSAAGTPSPYGPPPVYANPGTPPVPPPTNINSPGNPNYCTSDPSTVDYNFIDNTWAPIADPLAGQTGLTDPLTNPTVGLCPGQASPPVFTAPPATGLWLPGEYEFKDALGNPAPVRITQDAQFADCSGALDKAMTGYAGMFRFPNGLLIEPGSGRKVEGYNVTLAIGAPLALPGNVPGSMVGGVFVPSGPGNGGACMPVGSLMWGGQPEVGSTVCGGTSPPLYGVLAQNSSSPRDGTGSNFSLMMGGENGSKIILQAPQYGMYHDILLFQNRSVPANFGFDAAPGDAATITLTGVVYNASLPNYGADVPAGVIWDWAIPYYNAGTLQGGYGTGGAGQLAPSTGSVTIYGVCVVDDFNTDGNTDVTIMGQPYSFPGAGLGPGLIG